VVPGIDFSNDPLLAGRIHSYVDTQITRLGGPNFHEIPINAPIVPVHNNQRDGLHRQAIHRGRVAYEPNSLGGGCPFQAGAARGFVSFPQPVQEDKVRGKPEKFADHYTQATLFYESQTDFEKAHIVGGFRFELSKVTVPAIRVRMLASLANVSADLAQRVADGLGMELPSPLPKALAKPAKPEVTVSPALSLTALPGDGGIRTRKIAILVADGVNGDAVATLQAALLDAGAVPRLVGVRLGRLMTATDDAIEADSSLENSPGVLFDAVVLPDGDASVQTLSRSGQAAEFIQNQYRHGKTLLALGAARTLLEAQGIAATLPSGEPDPGVLLGDTAEAAVAHFIAAVSKHRHPARESDPPVV
jgi:catalase